jgi:hypothetical protein
MHLVKRISMVGQPVVQQEIQREREEKISVRSKKRKEVEVL